jgi:hypothetical protein
MFAFENIVTRTQDFRSGQWLRLRLRQRQEQRSSKREKFSEWDLELSGGHFRSLAAYFFKTYKTVCHAYTCIIGKPPVHEKYRAAMHY